MRYWGIWIGKAEAWLRDEHTVLCFPLQSVAQAHLDGIKDEWWTDQDLQVKEFEPDGEYPTTGIIPPQMPGLIEG